MITIATLDKCILCDVTLRMMQEIADSEFSLDYALDNMVAEGLFQLTPDMSRKNDKHIIQGWHVEITTQGLKVLEMIRNE